MTTKPEGPSRGNRDRRPTLLELVAVVVSLGLGMGLVRTIGSYEEGTDGSRVAVVEPLAAEASMGLAMGLLVAAPVLAAVQVGWRGRREPPSTAEGLWATTSALWLVPMGLAQVATELGMMLAPFIPAGQTVLALAAAIGYAGALSRRSVRHGLRWTDHLGFAATIVVGPLMLAGILLSVRSDF